MSFDMARLQLIGIVTAAGGPVDLSIGEGECAGLSGESGAGKSLLLRAAADLDPHGGTARLGDQACDEFSGPEWRRRVGFLPAEGAWWLPTVGEHFAVAENAWIEPLGLSAEVAAWDVARLSTGERQRLALARLLARSPRVLLLDEPTAALDEKNARAVEAIIARYRAEQGAAVLWVGHDRAQLARVASATHEISSGRLVGEGAA